MAYRFRDPTPVFDNLLGTDPAPGGQAFFYSLGTTIPKDTFREYDLTDPNTNPIILDSAGRFPFPVWMDGDYTYELKAANGSSIINPTDIRPEVAPGQAIPNPLGHDGEYLTVVGGLVTWSGPIWKLPDPTGSAGQMVVVDSSGTDYILQAQPAPPDIPDPDIVIVDSAPYSVQLGVSDNTTKFLSEYGSGTVPSNPSGRTSSVTVTLPTALVKCFGITITPNTPVVGSFGCGATFCATGYTLGSACSSFSVQINSADDDGSGSFLINPWNFTWKAEGTVTVP